MDLKPIRFIGEPIEVEFDRQPALEKKPGCPDRFIWREETYQVVELLSEWYDHSRRGRMATNMRASHLAVEGGIPLDVLLRTFDERFGKYKMLAVHYIWEDLFWQRKHESVEWLEKLIKL